jgi:hypothetical protein
MNKEIYIDVNNLHTSTDKTQEPEAYPHGQGNTTSLDAVSEERAG